MTSKMNRKVDHLISDSHWLIDPIFGRNAVAKYLHECSLGKSALKDLKRKKHFNNLASIYNAGELVSALSNEDLVAAAEEGDLDYESTAVVKLSGVMMLEDSLSNAGMRSLGETLYRLDGNVKQIILDINSGGGQVTAAFHLANVIADLQTPILAYVHYAASGGYMAACSCDFTVAAGEHVQFGSIGVALNLDKGAIKDMQKKTDVIYADVSSKKHEALRAYLNGDDSVFRASLNEMALAFHRHVAKHRTMSEEQQKIAFTGAVFSTLQAKELGLVDNYGSFKSALSFFNQQK